MSVLKDQFELMGSGSTFKEISATDFSNFKMLVPSLEEQSRIVSFLESKCLRIDELITAKKELIETLDGFSESIISDAVTKGLVEDASKKKCDVSWIKEIPLQWSLKKLKYLSMLGPSAAKSIDPEVEISYMPMECLRRGIIERRSAKPSTLSTGLNYFENGDLVMAKVTPCFENGNIAIAKDLINGCGLGTSEVFVFRPKGIEIEWLFYVLQHKALKAELVSTMTGVGGLKRINPGYMMNCLIPIPPKNEREQIINYLNYKSKQIADLISILGVEIEELKKYKTAIIHEAVTGKVKVL